MKNQLLLFFCLLILSCQITKSALPTNPPIESATAISLLNKRVLFLGNSITQNGLYVSLMEYAIQKNRAANGIEIFNIGLSSETVSCLTESDHPFPRPCLSERLDRALTAIQPDVVFASYGINDGIYHPPSEGRFKAYQKGILELIKKTEESGAQLVLLTPTPFDTLPIRDKTVDLDAKLFGYKTPYRNYDQVLKEFTDWLLTLASEGVQIIDWHTAINTATLGKRKQQSNFSFTKDGIHPTEDGHTLLAKLILENIGLTEEGQVLSNYASVANDSLFQAIRQKGKQRSARWRNSIGYTRGKTVQSIMPQSSLILMGGQSNMVGQGNKKDLSNRELPDKITFLDHGLNTTLQRQNDKFGPEYSLAKTLHQSFPNQHFTLLKYAVGGSSLLDWSPTYSEEKARITGHPEFGNMFAQLLQTIDSLKAYSSVKPTAMLWMQGERDARIPEAGKDYYNHFKQFIEAIRLSLDQPDFPFIFGMVNPPDERYPALEAVRKAQRKIAKELHNAFIIETDDLSKWEDNLHYDSDGLLEMGHRFGEQLVPILRQKQLENQLALLPEYQENPSKVDWLVETPKCKASVYKKGKKELFISNGLVSRQFILNPNVATVSLKNLRTSEEYIRSIQPEAVVMIDSLTYPIGGLLGQQEHGYFLPDWLNEMAVDSSAFTFQKFEIKDIEEHLKWKKTRWTSTTQWAATGKEITFYYQHSMPELKGIIVKIHYEIYDNIPLISKRLSIENLGNKELTINHFTSEIIAHPEKNNFVDIPKSWTYPNLYLENDYAFSGMTYEESNQALSWDVDPHYSSQVNWQRKMPCVIKSQPQIGPHVPLSPTEIFESFRTYILPLDGTDRERNTLAQRKMYRTIAPWISENPIFMHLTSTDEAVVKQAINQCAETGYEMVILSFGSGLTMEDTSADNILKFKTFADYAHDKGIQLGGYSLFSSRRINDETDVIDLETGLPGGAKFGGSAPCAVSQWGLDYFQKLKTFLNKTGFDILEHDGPYPGDFCASTIHPGHKNYFDSQWKQWRQSTNFYKWTRSNGIYTNIPDFYFLSGSNKVGIGYREVNWSLPRAQQIILGRQNIYDGTWTKTPSMNWTFVPLTEYHGGGDAATLEPLAEHLDSYEAHLIQNYKSGVQACYRGPRLYDTPTTKSLVKSSIDHYKKYRDILNADIIHLRRPDGRDWDGILHADPTLTIKGYAVLYNPLPYPIERTIHLPLYYTGIKNSTLVSVNGEAFQQKTLSRDYEITMHVTIPADGHIWIVFKDGK